MITSNNRVCYRKFAHPWYESMQSQLTSLPFSFACRLQFEFGFVLEQQNHLMIHEQVFVCTPQANGRFWQIFSWVLYANSTENSHLFIYRLISLKVLFSENANKNTRKKKKRGEKNQRKTKQNKQNKNI